MQAKLFSYNVKKIISITTSISKLILSPKNFACLNYAAGQYLKVLHADKSESPLSIANAPNAKHELEILLSHPEKNLPALDLLMTMRTKRQISFLGPFGSNTIKKLNLKKPIVFFVRGTGIAPVKAILEELQLLKITLPIFVFCGAYAKNDFFFEKLLQQFKETIPHFDFSLVLSRSKELDELHFNVLEKFPDLSELQIYASGAEEMVMSALHFFEAHGLKQNHFYSDVFDYLT